MSTIHLAKIVISHDFCFIQYLRYLPTHVANKIQRFYKRSSQQVAFASACLQYYYLPRYLGINPKDIVINVDSYGKPHAYIKNNTVELLELAIDFNITHSKNLVIIAIIDNRHRIAAVSARETFPTNEQIDYVGVDVEYIDASLSTPDALAKQVFSANECALISNNYDNFFRLWTKKEAFLKAYGTGFGDAKIYRSTSLDLRNQQTINYLIIANNSYQVKIYQQILNECYYFSICLLKRILF